MLIINLKPEEIVTIEHKGQILEIIFMRERGNSSLGFRGPKDFAILRKDKKELTDPITPHP